MFYSVEVGALGGPVQSANIVVGVPLHNGLLLGYGGRGGLVVRLLASRPGEQHSIPGLGSSRIPTCENRAGRCRWSASFLGDLPFSATFYSGTAPYSPRFTLIGSQDLAVKNRSNLFTLVLGHPLLNNPLAFLLCRELHLAQNLVSSLLCLACFQLKTVHDKVETVPVTRIPLIPSELPFEFRKLQFPLSVCFPMTINKPRGKTLKFAGVQNHEFDGNKVAGKMS
ncbi:hypothetical protein PR048_033236 [Dryococelus australis]|uniref:Uncharacterized protein n=1 Tax=Dryococelus australis TaxID=614101 RepID=A0ABQ9FZQ8_9NEOP|nr:hypothetical protein PR048_033236 [Dryococelus australis]